MSNIKFVYLYRDGGNFKNWGFCIFRNPDNLPIENIEQRLLASFWQGSLFIAEQVGLPELFHDDYPTIDDICFHEYVNSELTEEDETDSFRRTISVFVDRIEYESAVGWNVFDPRDRLSSY